MYAPTLVEMNTCQFAIERKMSIKFWNKFKKMQAPAPSGGLELWWAGSTTRNLTRIVREIPTMIIITEDLIERRLHLGLNGEPSQVTSYDTKLLPATQFTSCDTKLFHTFPKVTSYDTKLLPATQVTSCDTKLFHTFPNFVS
jgi:hypothetical protein